MEYVLEGYLETSKFFINVVDDLGLRSQYQPFLGRGDVRQSTDLSEVTQTRASSVANRPTHMSGITTITSKSFLARSLLHLSTC